MTTELTPDRWFETSVHMPSGAEPAVRGGNDEVARLVAAVGAVLGWEGAALLAHPADEARASLVVRSWPARSDDQFIATVPQWVRQIDHSTWGSHQLVWRPAELCNPRRPAVVAVPVYAAGELSGTLCLFGPRLQRPDATTTELLGAVAGLLGKEEARVHRTRSQAEAPGAGEFAVSTVDVFAFTVRVEPDGLLTWRYFGPNSQTIFGVGVPPDDALTVLLQRHVHVDDAERVTDLEHAFLAGRPLDIELRLMGLDGVTRWVSWRTVPRWHEGQLHIDGVATDVSSRLAIGRSRQELEASEVRRADQLREHALAVRDANDNVLQRLFAAGLRLQILKRRLSEVEAHAVTAVAFQLDQAATDLREVVLGLDAVATGSSV